MKAFGFEFKRVMNKIVTPQTEQVGKFKIQTQSSPRRTVSMQDYLDALKQAESVNIPLRYRLYDLYQESLDYVPHLKALIELRHLQLLSKEITYTVKDKELKQLTPWLQSPEFKQFMRDILDTKFWGFSLFDFSDIDSSWFSYDLINRKHVDPIKQVVYEFQYGGKGTPYNDKSRAKYIIALGQQRDLGLLKNATPYAIHLRNMTGDMMNYVELAGNNFTIYKDETADPRIANQINEAHKSIGSAGYMKLPGGVSREIENQSSSQQNQLFTSIHDLLNKELSKLLLGSTMGIEDGSSLSQAEVHERTMGKVFQADSQYVLDCLNYEFADKLALWGLPTNGVFTIVQNSKTQPLAVTLGVGGTQSLQMVVSDPNLEPEQKKNILRFVLFVLVRFL